MNRRRGLRGSTGAVVTALLRIAAAAWLLPTMPAQAHPEHPYEVVMVLPRPEGEMEHAFEEYFIELGTPVRTTVLAYSGRAADQPALIAQLRRLSPDLIYTWDTPTTLAVAGPARVDAGNEGASKGRNNTERKAEEYIRDIPIVFTSVSDPIAAGLVTDLEHPGRNLTGVIPLPPLPAQLNTIAAYRPFRTLGFLYDGRSRQTLAVRDHLRALARTQKFTLVDEPIPLNARGELEAASIPARIASLKARGAQFLYIGPETFIRGPLQDVVAHAALEAGLPSFSALESAVRHHGVLFGLVSPQRNVGRFAAYKAMRILHQHASPAAVPIETLQHFSPLINMGTAAELKIYPPLMLLDIAEVATATGTHAERPATYAAETP